MGKRFRLWLERHLEEAEGYVVSWYTRAVEARALMRKITPLDVLMTPTVEQEHEGVEEEDEMVVMERSTGTARRGSPSGIAAVPIPTVMRLDDHVSSGPLSSSLLSGCIRPHRQSDNPSAWLIG